MGWSGLIGVPRFVGSDDEEEEQEEEEEHKEVVAMGISKPALSLLNSNLHTCARRVSRVLITILLVPFLSRT